MSQRAKGRIFTNEQRRKIGEATKKRLSIHNHLKGTKASDQTKQKRSKSMKRWFLTHPHPMIGKHLNYKRKQLSEEDKLVIKENRKYRIIPKKDSKPERMMQIALTLHGIKFEKHKPILGQPDIFIEPNICVFIDGDYWHRLPNVILRDIEVNHKLNLLGYQIIRIWEKDIRRDANSHALNIINLINKIRGVTT